MHALHGNLTAIRARSAAQAASAQGRDVIPANEMQQHLSRLVREWLAVPHRTLGQLADLCDGSPGAGTISRIASRETQHPRLHTVAALYRAMGWQVYAVHGAR